MSHQTPPDKDQLLSPDERYRLGQIYSLILSWQNGTSDESCLQTPKADADDKRNPEVIKPEQQE